MGTKWDIEGFSGDNLEFWKVKMEAILMFRMMDKTLSVVIWYLRDKKLMEILKKKALVVSNWEPVESLVMNSGCSYHMCSKKEYFETLVLLKGGVVHLGDGKACKVQ
ncbi:hypothetical protein A2U01_0046582, partial [Trifolium medium]|nr:hypothetical protein [Trifolium medium]